MQRKSFGKEKDFMIVLQIFIDFSLNWIWEPSSSPQFLRTSSAISAKSFGEEIDLALNQAIFGNIRFERPRLFTDGPDAPYETGSFGLNMVAPPSLFRFALLNSKKCASFLRWQNHTRQLPAGGQPRLPVFHRLSRVVKPGPDSFT